jgi:hypothetical protein
MLVERNKMVDENIRLHHEWTLGKPKSEASFAASDGSAENVRLPNDTKIRFCNAVDGMKAHCILCKECDIYMRWGDGDLCSAGKTIIAMELCNADTNVEFPPNNY